MIDRRIAIAAVMLMSPAVMLMSPASANAARPSAPPVQAAEPLVSLKPTPRFKRIGLEEHLPQLSAYAIVQDPQGFVWVGTGEGLARYDGYDFKVFQWDPASKNTISNNGVTALFDDGEGNLWIGTNEGGLDRYEHATE